MLTFFAGPVFRGSVSVFFIVSSFDLSTLNISVGSSAVVLLIESGESSLVETLPELLMRLIG